MRRLSADRLDLIDALLAEADTGSITAALLEKDEHLTAALHAVFALQFEHATLVLCGGTSLSKAHGLIERMSEDADIKVMLANSTANWSVNRLRRYLGDEVRARVLAALAQTGLVEDSTKRQSLNGNRYVHSQWIYQRVYDGIAALRPNIQIELIVRRAVLPTTRLTVGTLADRLACRSPAMQVISVTAVAETLAEKVLSFLRRYAQHHAGTGRRKQTWDTALVRHIHDVHCILSQVPGVLADADRVFTALMHGDVTEFGHQDQAFANSPSAVLSMALETAHADIRIRQEYDTILLPLIYGLIRPGFDQAWTSFERAARRMLDPDRLGDPSQDTRDVR